MSAPHEACCLLMVKVHLGQRVATSPTPNRTFREVTSCMKLTRLPARQPSGWPSVGQGGGRHRVATQVKLLSPSG